MPKYHKTDRIELWRNESSWQDNTGSWHDGRPAHLATLWASFKGKDYALLYQTQGVWAKPTFEATITRPKRLKPQVGDHVRHDGTFYVVRQVNDLTGQVGHDMKLTCEEDSEYRS